MAQMHDNVLDFGVDYVHDNTTELHILSQDPGVATYGNIATYTLGKKVGPTVSNAQDGATSGRRVVVSAISDGSVTATGTATHFALVDTTNSAILVTGALGSSQSVTSGNTFTLTEFSVTIPDPA